MARGSFKNVYRKLTSDQKERGVVYSSMIVVMNEPSIEPVLHEVFRDDPDKWDKIKRLQDVAFFKRMAVDFGYKAENIIRR